MHHAVSDLKLPRLVAIVTSATDASRAVLLKLGMREEGRLRLSPAREEVLVFGCALDGDARS